jgi:hypothetical protein
LNQTADPTLHHDSLAETPSEPFRSLLFAQSPELLRLLGDLERPLVSTVRGLDRE